LLGQSSSQKQRALNRLITSTAGSGGLLRVIGKKEQHHRDDIAHFARLIQHLPSSVLCETYFA
jgi:hypothetical protein